MYLCCLIQSCYSLTSDNLIALSLKAQVSYRSIFINYLKKIMLSGHLISTAAPEKSNKLVLKSFRYVFLKHSLDKYLTTKKTASVTIKVTASWNS